MTIEDISNYIMGNSSDQNAKTNQSVIVRESDGSMTLVDYGKDIKILSTNLLGCKIMMSGIAKLNILLIQDPQNEYVKNPRLRVYVGTVFVLGFIKLEIQLFDYQKYFPPLSLKFTLEQI